MIGKTISKDKTSLAPKKRVLLIDDDADLMILMKEFIKEKISGADFDVANDPYEALNMMSEQSYDLVVLDWNLQGLNGYQALLEAERGFKVDPNLPSQWSNRATPVVVFSAEPKEACIGMDQEFKYFKYAGHVNKKTGLDRVLNAIYAHYLLTA